MRICVKERKTVVGRETDGSMADQFPGVAEAGRTRRGIVFTICQILVGRKAMEQGGVLIAGHTYYTSAVDQQLLPLLGSCESRDLRAVFLVVLTWASVSMCTVACGLQWYWCYI